MDKHMITLSYLCYDMCHYPRNAQWGEVYILASHTFTDCTWTTMVDSHWCLTFLVYIFYLCFHWRYLCFHWLDVGGTSTRREVVPIWASTHPAPCAAKVPLALPLSHTQCPLLSRKLQQRGVTHAPLAYKGEHHHHVCDDLYLDDGGS